MKFSVFNAYDLPKLDKTFDQIICSETLEHIKNDKLIVGYFSQLLNPGGILHLCCPFSEHKVHKLGRTDVPEDGGHVRDGYTIETYAALLEGQGFKIIDSMGLGTPSLVMCDSFLRGIRNRFGDVFAVPFFLLMWPFLTFIDKPVINVPFSLYVKAVKI